MTATVSLPHKILFILAIIICCVLIYFPEWSLLVFSLLLIGSVSYIFCLTGYKNISMLMVASLPFSTNYQLPGTASDIRLPSEFLILIISSAFVLQKIFLSPYSKKIWNHAVTKLLVALLAVQVISSFTSSMPEVSLKAMAIKLLYISVFYFAFAEIFLNDQSIVKKYFGLYIFMLAITVIYTLHHHAQFDFDKNYTSYMPLPFFSDHTIYSACIVFTLPLLIVFIRHSKYLFGSRGFSILTFLILILFCLAVFISASRAAWLSILVMGAVTTILFFRIKTIHLAVLFFVAGIFAMFNSDSIINSIKTNRNDSKKITADIQTQAKSITNITNDNSNAERINRWKCAWRMAIKKPIKGFGTGTYQFQYISFQKPEDLTPISVTSAYHITKGRGGTAHNDLLLILSENGFIAVFLFASMMILVVHRGATVYYNLKDKNQRALLLAIFLGWISYSFHSLFNNFLETDKAAFLFYAGMAVVVVMDLKMKETKFQEVY